MNSFYETQIRTRQQLRAFFMNADLRKVAFSAWVYSHRDWRMDSETVQILFHALEELLAMSDSEPREQDNVLYRLLNVLGLVASPEALTEFIRHRGRPIEEKLAGAAESWIENETHFASMKHVGEVLLRFGGTGITRFINAKLKSNNQMTRLNAIKQACIRPDDETIRTLWKLQKVTNFTNRAFPSRGFFNRRQSNLLLHWVKTELSSKA